MDNSWELAAKAVEYRVEKSVVRCSEPVWLSSVVSGGSGPPKYSVCRPVVKNSA